MRTSSCCAPLLSLLLAGCTVDATPEPGAVARATPLVEQALAQGQAMALLRQLVTAAPHRLSGSAGAQRAVEWAQAAMTAADLERVRLDPCQVPHWVRGTVARAQVVAPVAEELKVLALGGSVATPPEGLEAEVVMVRSFDELKQLGAAAQGRIVFFNRPMPRVLANTFQAYGQAVDQRGQGAVEAARAGGVAALVRSMTTALDDFPHTGSMQYDPQVARVPALAVSTLGAERLATLLRAGTPVRLRLLADCATLPDVPSANVLGEIRGRELPDEVVVVGGHLDAWDAGQGAHDDGAGCVQSIGALRLLRALGITPRRTIRAVLFMNEENGLRGARAYAEAHKDEKHFAAIETDRGGFEPKGFDTTLKGPDFVRVQQIVRALEPWGMGALIPGGGGADISVLGPMNVPLFGLIPASSRYFDLHHSDRDRIEEVNERELELGAAALAWLAWQLADL